MTKVINPESMNPIVVAKSEFRGYEGIDIRKFYYDDEGELRPTRKGIWIRVELIDDIIEAIQEELERR